MPKIFISYRRDDSASQAGRLYDRLEGHFGQGRLVMLVGEPGIGKTRTAQELASIAERQGAQVL